MRHAVAAGAQPVKPGQKTFWGGYAGFFKDGPFSEILLNPAFIPAA